MAEKLNPSHERLNTHEAGEAAGERLEELSNKAEKFDEGSQERAAEHARKQAELEAIFSKEQGSERRSDGEPSDPAPKIITKEQKNVEYNKTMKSIRAQLPRASRTFSKVIHNPAVEKTSEAIGSTVARPNAILAGGFTALVAVAGVYLLAQYVGFRLSGFETIAAFVIGWLVGMSFDLLKAPFKR